MRRSHVRTFLSLVAVALLVACSAPPTAQENQAPTIGTIPDQRTTRADAIDVGVTIADEAPDTVTLAISSTDPTLVGEADVDVLGSGAERTLRIAPDPVGFGSVDLTLTARDAEGLASSPETFRLDVQLPFERPPDPLRSPDAAAYDAFGSAIAVDGDRLIVGEVGDDAPYASGPIPDNGAAHVFRRTAGGWVPEARLQPGDLNDGAGFGWSVAIDGTVAVVGAPAWSDGLRSGAAYVFTYRDGAWTDGVRLEADDPLGFSDFGSVVDVAGDYVVVGAPWYAPDAPGAVAGQGAVFVYRRSGEAWTPLPRIDPPGPNVNMNFGHSLALGSDDLVVGAIGDDHGGTIVNAGAAFVYRRSGDAWVFADRLESEVPSANDFFGSSVATGIDQLAVGASGVDRSGVDTWEGAAFVFERVSESDWRRAARLVASASVPQARFGSAVAIAEPYIVVGAQEESIDGVSEAGAAYVFRGEGPTWDEVARLEMPGAAEAARFGRSVALDADTAYVAAYYEDVDDEDEGSVHLFPR
jgi:hypothetical protein